MTANLKKHGLFALDTHVTFSLRTTQHVGPNACVSCFILSVWHCGHDQETWQTWCSQHDAMQEAY